MAAAPQFSAKNKMLVERVKGDADRAEGPGVELEPFEKTYQVEKLTLESEKIEKELSETFAKVKENETIRAHAPTYSTGQRLQTIPEIETPLLESGSGGLSADSDNEDYSRDEL